MNRLLWTLVLAASLATAAGAATFTVDTTTDAVDAVPGDGACAAAGGGCTLRAAVQEANALAGADDVTLPAGIFLLTVLGPGEDAAATGDLDVTQPLTVTGAGAGATIVDGIASDRVFHAMSVALTLRGLTIRNGLVGTSGAGVAGEAGAAVTLEDATFRFNRANDGGAILVEGPLVIAGARFENNLAASAAGAVAVVGPSGTLDMRDAVFEDNLAQGTGGSLLFQGTGAATIAGSTFRRNAGDIAPGGMVASASAVTITDTLIEDNSTLTGGNVGGLYVAMATTATLQNVTIRRNSTDGVFGGLGVAATGDIIVSGCTVEDNFAADNGGGPQTGGLFASSMAGNLTIQDTTIRSNRTLGQAGALRVTLGTGSMTLRNVVVEDNTALSNLGGVLAEVGGTVLVEGSQIVDNIASDDVGGIYVTSTGNVTFADTTVRGNQALGVGAGAYLATGGGAIDVQGCTFADNLAFGPGGNGAGLVVAAMSTVVGNSTFSGNWAQATGGALLASGGPVLVTNTTLFGNTAGNPGAAIVAAGSTVTLRSTAIGASDTASCTAALGSDGDNVDQDGSCLLAGPRDRSGLDPQLGPLQDNGGPTFTHEPLATSPLLDGVGGGACPATDQRGVARPTDGNGDGAAACDIGSVEFVDECPSDPAKRLPGVCGCGVPDVDANANGAVDCLINAELKAQIAAARALMQSLTGVKSDAETAMKAQLTEMADGLLAYCTTNEATIVKTDPKAKLTKLAKKARKALRATRKGKGGALQKKQKRAGKALDRLDAAVAPQ